MKLIHMRKGGFDVFCEEKDVKDRKKAGFEVVAEDDKKEEPEDDVPKDPDFTQQEVGNEDGDFAIEFHPDIVFGKEKAVKFEPEKAVDEKVRKNVQGDKKNKKKK